MTPTQRTRNYYRSRGFVVGTVERFVSPGGRGGHRKDLFGIIDLIAIAEGRVIGVQSTGADFAGHHRKLLGASVTRCWLESGAELHLIAWRREKAIPRVHEYTLDELPPPQIPPRVPPDSKSGPRKVLESF